ncbi:MAG: hypothetical protein FJZ00_12200 [Candidatus Sericytochromatia bacterium]|uniref:Uncharacterized protein n=1 Tax=Candidatus Tanganyikabacteria bacterium TaxID=2961651 RepID=A0A937X5X2_9BACT|nr:hypothetical protein [Candidatus Tanganyikabacteria bacterium]
MPVEEPKYRGEPDREFVVLFKEDVLRPVLHGNTDEVNAEFGPITPHGGGLPLQQLERIRVICGQVCTRPLRPGDVVALGKFMYVYDGIPPQGGFSIIGSLEKAQIRREVELIPGNGVPYRQAKSEHARTSVEPKPRRRYLYFDADDILVRIDEGDPVPEALGRDGIWRRWSGFSRLRNPQISPDEAARMAKQRKGDLDAPPSTIWVGADRKRQ